MKTVIAALLGAALAAATAPVQADLWARDAWEAPPAPQRFLIERHMPGASRTTAEEFRLGAAKSNAVLRELGADIQWVHSYVAGDKVYCVYQAPSEALIREHAKRSGFPADKITPIVAVLDPTTAAQR
jgi:hypothetical protein